MSTASAWIILFFAGLCEIGWATGLKAADSPLEWALTVLLVIISLSLVTQIAKTLPASTTYAIFVGLGTVGTVVADLLFFDLEFYDSYDNKPPSGGESTSDYGIKTSLGYSWG